VLHEARHTFASLMIAAGVNAKALSEFMGHATIVVTLDLYSHLMPGSHDEAAALLDRYLQQAREDAARAAESAAVTPRSVQHSTALHGADAVRERRAGTLS
jgi:hypothetical protein